MTLKKIPLQQIFSFLGDDLIKVHGNPIGGYIDNLADTYNVNATTLDWINPSKSNKQDLVLQSRAKSILVDGSVLYTEALDYQQKVLIVVKNPKKSLANIGNHFFVEKKAPTIHPTAIIDTRARIGKRVSIGAYSVVGNCEIADDTVIDAHVTIYDGVVIGKHCVVKPGSVLGSEGFGFERDEHGNRFRFPQIGGLFIGEFVEIGANTCIDRGALSDTTIGSYTKINNLCHIAHNNKIGNNVIITACVNISGSNIIENNVWIAPNASVKGWVKIGEGAIVGMGAVVTKDIPANETWVGCPAKKMMK